MDDNIEFEEDFAKIINNFDEVPDHGFAVAYSEYTNKNMQMLYEFWLAGREFERAYEWINAKDNPPTDFPVWGIDKWGVIELCATIRYFNHLLCTHWLPESAIPKLPTT